MHLSADYWIDNLDHPDEVLMAPEKIAALNGDSLANDPNLVELASYPEQVSHEVVERAIRSISKPYHADLFYRDGGKVSAADYEGYTGNLNLDGLQDEVSVRYALVLERADMRTWPTRDVVFKSRETRDLDRFQENGLFPAEVVVVLHESEDGLWCFVQSYNYGAWVLKNKVVTGPREEVIRYRDKPDFMVVTGSKVTTNLNPRVPAVSELQLDMGVRLPLAELANRSNNGSDRLSETSYAVQVPVRGKNGKLEFETATIARSQDVHLGYLPYTRKNIILQAFKFLGEPYGWGHSFNARDCTGLVSEVYKTMGIYLPRNSRQQCHSPIGDNTSFSPEATAEEKLSAVAKADVGDLLYSTDHVMVYLGTEDTGPFVIHDVSGSGWVDAEGEHHKGTVNGVSVTPLLPTRAEQQHIYFEQMYAIKQIR